MNLSEKESEVFSRLTLSQREEISQFPPALRSRTLADLSSVRSDYGKVIAKAKLDAVVMSIIKGDGNPGWSTNYTEQGLRRAENNKASFLPPIPDWMREEREAIRKEEVKAWADRSSRNYAVPTSNLNGRGGFGD
ncbi:hypothetical protein [Rosenbergiella collisarenosi]|uniref:hypothetical protein n=1 Tax=Rosenbergiella collisarenosi TaxID=1544695 RepID=UPI001F4D3779|nr:hypothetical protein [Rosenbergiella collisarenosi]